MLNKTAYCFRCDLIKLPRTHHCNTCQRCIQRMDHHCPWIGNCVGRDNHKYFTLFLFYTTLTLLTVVLSIALDVAFGEHIINSMDDMCRYITYGVCICCGMLLLSIGFLLVTQLATIMQNITTLESFTKGIEDHNVFDKGSVWANMEVIFGQGCWLLPTQPSWQADQPSLY